jgi:hypothetical protein
MRDATPLCAHVPSLRALTLRSHVISSDDLVQLIAHDDVRAYWEEK